MCPPHSSLALACAEPDFGLCDAQHGQLAKVHLTVSGFAIQTPVLQSGGRTHTLLLTVDLLRMKSPRLLGSRQVSP